MEQRQLYLGIATSNGYGSSGKSLEGQATASLSPLLLSLTDALSHLWRSCQRSGTLWLSRPVYIVAAFDVRFEPFVDCIEVATLVDRVEVRPQMISNRDPILEYGRCIGMAHEDLAQHLRAMIWRLCQNPLGQQRLPCLVFVLTHQHEF